MSSKLCIHGHFYQPPRFNPWVEEVLPEPSAAPYSNWNQRINRESYDPLGFARILDEQGRVKEIVNCYEYINFNFGPTILRWMAKHAPGTYQRILEGDRKSVQRLGRGNAMAQIYHHIIMPLTTDADREVEIQWSIQDFESRFGRKPEGFWLSETAVCTDDLEALARAGVRFTVLAPSQARAISDAQGANWAEVNEDTLPKDRPYLVRLPSGREIAVFFYDGGISQAVAFENLLADGEAFWQSLLKKRDHSLLSLATDGESYGHHFKFGEMALAYVLKKAMQPDSPFALTNFSAYLDEHPPSQEVEIHENSSWSCAHGVGRWQDDCGCSTGDYPHGRQHWRKPLRRALNFIRYYVDEFYRHKGEELLRDRRQALLEYGRCLCDSISREEFLSQHSKGATQDNRAACLKLLEMQRMSLASFASCAWFFDDLGRIEPLNALSYGLRALEMLRELQGPDVEPELLELLEEAQSNDPQIGDGVRIWREHVLPRKIDTAQMAVVGACWGGRKTDFDFPGLKFRVEPQENSLNIDYTWPCLWEQGRDTFFLTQGEPGQFRPCNVQDSQGNLLGLQDLDAGMRSYVLLSWDQEQDTRLVEDLLQTSAELKEEIKAPFVKGQKQPLAGSGILSLGLLVHQIRSGEKEGSDWIGYWKQVLQDNPILVSWIKHRINRELDQLTGGSDPDWSQAARLIQGCKAMGVHPDLYLVQNRIWKTGTNHLDPDLLEKFYFRAR